MAERAIGIRNGAKCVLLLLLVGVFLPATTLCEDDDGDGEVIPAQLPVNDRQIDDVVEELIKDGHDVSNLRPLLGLHGKTRRSASKFTYNKRLTDSMRLGKRDTFGDSMRLGKRQSPRVRERMRLGKRSAEDPMRPQSVPDLSLNYLSNPWQDDYDPAESWEGEDLKDMLRNQLFGKRDLPFPVDFWDKHGEPWTAPGDSMRLGKRPMADSMRLGKRLMGDSMRLGKKSMGDSMRLGKRLTGDSMRLGKKSMGDSMRLGKKSMGDSMRLGKKSMGDSMRLGKRLMGDSMRLGKKSMGDSMRLGKKSMGDSMRLGKRSMGNSMRLGKRSMGDSMRLGKRDPWAGDDPWLQDYNSRLSQDYDEDYDIEKRAFDDSIRLGKRSRLTVRDTIRLGKRQSPYSYMRLGRR